LLGLAKDTWNTRLGPLCLVELAVLTNIIDRNIVNRLCFVAYSLEVSSGGENCHDVKSLKINLADRCLV